MYTKQTKRITAIALTLLLLCSVFILPGASAATASSEFIGRQTDQRSLSALTINTSLAAYSNQASLTVDVNYGGPPPEVTAKLTIVFLTSSGEEIHEINLNNRGSISKTFNTGDFILKSATAHIKVQSGLVSYENTEFDLAVGT